MPNWIEQFDAFVTEKTRTARAAAIPGYRTRTDDAAGHALERVGNNWSRRLFDGPFYLSTVPSGSLPAISTVFVQSADGNTGSDRPIELGGGLTDKHLIYEGLSGVAADAVLTGTLTIKGEQMVFGVWHPELVDLRASLGLPRYPAQLVATRSGELEIDHALLYNVPELRVFILTGDAGAAKVAPSLRTRPWITIINSGDSGDVLAALASLRRDHDITRVSCVGGRTLTTSLIDAGAVQDIYLTTSATPGGEPNTPFYTGKTPLKTTTIVGKMGLGVEEGVRFEHLQL